MTVPHDVEITELVNAYVKINQLRLTPIQIQKLAEVAKAVWSNQTKVCFVSSCHRYVYEDAPDAGQYRQTQLLGISGRFRAYPRPTLISQLMVRVFGRAYRNALEEQQGKREYDLGDTAWYTGATLRAIHPFMTGNIILSWVIENQLRLKHGLPVHLVMRPKSEFDEFREEGFRHMVEAILQNGAST
jgi:fido (protein-threonine AMPylation protein)